MADEEPGRELPQRVRGAARTGPSVSAPSSSPVLSEDLRQRIRAAVTAERSGVAAREREGPPGGESTIPGGGSDGRGKRDGGEPLPLSRRTAGRSVNAGPVAEDEVTEWLAAAKAPSAADPARAASPLPADAARKAAAKPSRSGARLAAWALIAVLASALLGVAAVRYLARSTVTSRPPAVTSAQAAAARGAAAAWVAQQVSHDVLVSCDQVMCAALEARGFPSRELLGLGPTSQNLTTSVVVVETPAVQHLFGSSLATAWAPAVLASFGSGSAAITVRVIAPHGAAAYQTLLDSDLADRRSAGTALLNDPQITVAPPARGQLSTGAVDSRLLLALAALAGHQPISIVQFGNASSGATAGVPLRFADLAENVPAAHLSRAAYVKAVRAYMSTVPVRFRPARMTTVARPDGQAVLRVEFTAPSPLGVFRAPSSK
jgi:hypothetical protein